MYNYYNYPEWMIILRHNKRSIFCLINLKVEDSRENKMSFTDQQLEECDAFPEDVEYIFRLDVKTGEVTHKVSQ